MDSEIKNNMKNILPNEYEASFVNINKDDIRLKLQKIGAIKIYNEKLMRRINYFIDNILKDSWLRVRDEGNKVTVSIKQWQGSKINDQKEMCIVVNSFDETVKLFDTLLFKRKSYQETLREEWKYNDVQITIDTWPGLDPYIEIEAKDEESVKNISNILGFDYNDAVFGPVGVIYQKTRGIPEIVINEQTPIITFENPPKP